MNDRIKSIRESFKMTQEEFGKRIGSARNTIANYENGNRNPSNSVILSICREFNVNEEWLRTGNGEMFLEMTPIEKAYSEFGDIMENASPTKVATLTMLIEMIKRLPDDEWDYIMNQYNEALKEAKK